jgi:hypothetical protein
MQAWWVLPLAEIITLGVSLWRGHRNPGVILERPANPIVKVALSFQGVRIHAHISLILTAFHDRRPAAITFERRLVDVWIKAAHDAAFAALVHILSRTMNVTPPYIRFS